MSGGEKSERKGVKVGKGLLCSKISSGADGGRRLETEKGGRNGRALHSIVKILTSTWDEVGGIVGVFVVVVVLISRK